MKMQTESLFILLVSIVLSGSNVMSFENRTTNILSKYFGEICGETFSDRIISGKNASLGQFPWMARIHVLGFGFICGGALISDRHVISAAHCLTNDINGVLLGEHNTKTDPDCEDEFCADKAQFIKAASFSIPDEYDSIKYAHDILLIKLARRAQFNDFVIPICLPTGNERKPRANNEVEIAEVAGWGYTDYRTLARPQILQYAKIKIQRMEECAKVFNSVKVTRQICAGDGSNEQDNQDSCGGDSGGPLMQILIGDNGPRYFITGIVSFGRLSCGDRHPAIYTRVLTYLNFISEKIENDF